MCTHSLSLPPHSLFSISSTTECAHINQMGRGWSLLSRRSRLHFSRVSRCSFASSRSSSALRVRNPDRNLLSRCEYYVQQNPFMFTERLKNLEEAYESILQSHVTLLFFLPLPSSTPPCSSCSCSSHSTSLTTLSSSSSSALPLLPSSLQFYGVKMTLVKVIGLIGRTSKPKAEECLDILQRCLDNERRDEVISTMLVEMKNIG
jgi:hypothetical protein